MSACLLSRDPLIGIDIQVFGRCCLYVSICRLICGVLLTWVLYTSGTRNIAVPQGPFSILLDRHVDRVPSQPGYWPCMYQQEKFEKQKKFEIP